jgi:hypothetical protein
LDNIEMDLREIEFGGVGWIDWLRIRTILNKVMNLRRPKNVGSSRVAAQLAASQERPRSMELVKASKCWVGDEAPKHKDQGYSDVLPGQGCRPL